MKSPAFIVKKDPTVPWPVTVTLAENGKLVQYRFTAAIRVMPEGYYAALLDQDADEAAQNKKLEDVLARNAQVLPKVVCGWDVSTDDGYPVGIDELPSMLTGPYGRALSIGLHQAVAAVRYGLAAPDAAPVEDATTGNSAPPPVTGSN